MDYAPMNRSFAGGHLPDLPDNVREAFTKEVDSGNFMLGGQSVIFVGPDACESLPIIHSCLLLANVPAYLTTPFEIIQAAKGNAPIFRHSEDRRTDLENAEVVIVADFFEKLVYTPEDQTALHWFIRDGLHLGVTFVFAADSDDADMPFNEAVEKLIEDRVELIYVTKTTKSAKKSKRKLNGAAASK